MYSLEFDRQENQTKPFAVRHLGVGRACSHQSLGQRCQSTALGRLPKRSPQQDSDLGECWELALQVLRRG